MLSISNRPLHQWFVGVDIYRIFRGDLLKFQHFDDAGPQFVD
jgi:hypothetical protein